MGKHLKITAIILILLGLAARAAVVCNSGPSPHYSESISIDEVNYLELASNVVDFKTYGAWSEGFFTQSTRSPGYPALLASMYLFSGKDSPWLPQALNLLLDLLNIILVYMIGRNIYGGRVGLAATVLYSTLGASLIYVKFATPEIFALTLLLSLCFFITCLKNHYRSSIAGFVIVFAYLIHTRPAFLLVLPLSCLCIYFCISSENRLRRIWKSIIPIIAVLLLCIPWTARNYMIHKTLVPVSTFSGWHLIIDAEGTEELSLKKLTDHVYDPKRKGFTEGEYFSESKDLFMKIFFKNPAKLLVSGIYRFSYYWIPQQPYIRIFQPKAYVMPVYLTDRMFIPFPDFEGILYLSLMILAVAIYRLKSKFAHAAKPWIIKSSPLLLLILFYTLVHMIGMPLEQYRFLIEPVFIILLCGFTFDIFLPAKTRPIYMLVDIFYIMLIPACLCLMLVALFMNKPEKTIFEYPDMQLQQNSVSYAGIRELQWKNLGNVPEKTVCETNGEVKYVVNGFQFDGKTGGAVQKEDSAAGKLYVSLHDPQNPMGVGDMKINFMNGKSPRNGDIIKVKGPVITGECKELIMQAEKWENLR
ncbi:MAG: glycosyltransferase family 39 protein [Victivallales bacterium]